MAQAQTQFKEGNPFLFENTLYTIHKVVTRAKDVDQARVECIRKSPCIMSKVTTASVGNRHLILLWVPDVNRVPDPKKSKDYLCMMGRRSGKPKTR